MFSGHGRTNDFRELRHKLYVIATELNSGSSVRFGERGHDHVPISRAIQASTALPGLYPPVPIDGHIYVDGAHAHDECIAAARRGRRFRHHQSSGFDASAYRRAERQAQGLDLTRGLPAV
jgi:predicted acylesterase/phospholipase RssA